MWYRVQFQRLVRLGLVRHIGTSNMTIPKLRLLLRDFRWDRADRVFLHPAA